MAPAAKLTEMADDEKRNPKGKKQLRLQNGERRHLCEFYRLCPDRCLYLCREAAFQAPGCSHNAKGGRSLFCVRVDVLRADHVVFVTKSGRRGLGEAGEWAHEKHRRRAGNGPAPREEALPLQPRAVCRERSKQAVMGIDDSVGRVLSHKGRVEAEPDGEVSGPPCLHGQVPRSRRRKVV